MSIRIALENQPEFYTNLDIIRGQVVFSLSRQEQISAVIVKLEGESRTALGIPPDASGRGISQRHGQPVGDTVHENHKILYKVAQVFPEENAPAALPSYILQPGQHRFPFQFKFPFNNACGDPAAMARMGGIASAGLFGMSRIRVMDGSRQLLYKHVTKTLPPSFTGFPGEAEIRYYVKVTVQRPGLFKENWRYHIGLKFLPIEPPRPPKSNREAYARRPFTFNPRAPKSLAPPAAKKRSSFFTSFHGNSSQTPLPNDPLGTGPDSSSLTPPSIEMSCRLPYPAILSCHRAIPLRLIAKKLMPANAEIFLIAIQIDLIAQTIVRCEDLINTETNRWVVVSRQGLSIPISQPSDAVGTEFVVPDELWRDDPLPNTVMPSFVTCNLSRDYQIEVKLGLAWGKPLIGNASSRGRINPSEIPQEIHLPLHFSSVEVYSGLAPPPELVEALRHGRGRRPAAQPQRPATAQASVQPAAAAQPVPVQPPALPPRRPTMTPQEQETAALYPPQLGAGQVEPPYDDAPPSYDEAMAEEMTGPVFPPTARPAYSGVTNENSPSTLPEKS
ncbi:hypothetical protein B0H63DRAFT_222712 [Podospora didyma]|uniref:Arrestin-like N-terminal domain-containing protein n=1 Tax=Podospora didyma TaxID=330526 RepID=A0AAE0NCK6_9PEZI|nr:hypothetical protein B0H63DRAFT_222712 [Podospora didyma]